MCFFLANAHVTVAKLWQNDTILKAVIARLAGDSDEDVRVATADAVFNLVKPGQSSSCKLKGRPLPSDSGFYK
jgi:hypothetical protein